MLKGILGFEWDDGNRDKNEVKHGVTSIECEEVFSNRPLILSPPRHVGSELRYSAHGRTNDRRVLCVVFTVRRKRIRVISARSMSRKERRHYEAETKTEAGSKIQE